MRALVLYAVNGNGLRGFVAAGRGAYSYNLRFPGQYFDAETGLSYNYFRDYDPSLGRYIESDPIGLGGGLNTFGYVDEKSDPRGLIPPGADPECFRRGECKCATPECAAGLSPSTPGSWAKTPLSKKCEYKCSLVVGSICKPAYKVPAWWAKIATYVGCETVVEYSCGWVCEHEEQCKAAFKAVANSPLDLKYLPAGF